MKEHLVKIKHEAQKLLDKVEPFSRDKVNLIIKMVDGIARASNLEFDFERDLYWTKFRENPPKPQPLVEEKEEGTKCEPVIDAGCDQGEK